MFFSPIPVEIFVIWHFLRKPLRGPFSMFIVSIAISDLVQCVSQVIFQVQLILINFIQIMSCFQALPYQYTLSFPQDYGYDFNLCLHVSCGFMRFLALFFPFLSRNLISYRVFTILISFASIFAFFIAIFPIQMSDLKFFTCIDVFMAKGPYSVMALGIRLTGISLLILFYTPSIIKMKQHANQAISIATEKSAQEAAAKQRRFFWQSVLVAGMMFGRIIISLGFSILSNYVNEAAYPGVYIVQYIASDVVTASDILSNPVIYYKFNADFRRIVKGFFGCSSQTDVIEMSAAPSRKTDMGDNYDNDKNDDNND